MGQSSSLVGRIPLLRWWMTIMAMTTIVIIDHPDDNIDDDARRGRQPVATTASTM
jgi:hypothetical protein